MALADRLGRFIHEIEDLPLDEFNEWIAYFNVTAEKDKKRGAGPKS